MKNMRAVNELNEKELRLYGAKLVENPEISWHADYSHSPYIYVGGLHFDLTEGDILTVFSQYGKVTEVNLIRDKETGKSKGYAFVGYEYPKSAVLAVDNFNGITLANRKIRVDHVLDYKPKKKEEDKSDSSEDSEERRERKKRKKDKKKKKKDKEKKREKKSLTDMKRVTKEGDKVRDISDKKMY